ncbi:hypothetical protein, partial [Massilia sp. SYSU DXS3249]
ALEIKTCYTGMMLLISPAAWRPYDAIGAPKLSHLLLDIAAHARPKALRKAPQGPRRPKKKVHVSAEEKRRHVSTARVLKDGFVR